MKLYDAHTRIEELRHKIDQQEALLQDAQANWMDEQERADALAAHVERITAEWNKGDDQFSDEWINRMGDILEDAPTTSLARVKDKAQADLLSGLLTNHLEFAHPEAGPIVELMVKLEAALRQQAEGANQ